MWDDVKDNLLSYRINKYNIFETRCGSNLMFYVTRIQFQKRVEVWLSLIINPFFRSS